MKEPKDVLQALDIIVRHGPHLNMVPIDRNLLRRSDQDNSRDGAGLRGQEIAYGLFLFVQPVFRSDVIVIDRSVTLLHLSVQPVFRSDVIVIDRSVTLFHKAGSVRDFLIETAGRGRMGDIRRLTSEGSRALKGLEVRVNHLTYRRKYKVRDVTPEKASGITIQLAGEEKVAVSLWLSFSSKSIRRKLIQTCPVSRLDRTSDPTTNCLPMDRHNCLPMDRHNCLSMDVCELVPDQLVVRVSPAAQQQLIRVSARTEPQRRADELAGLCADFIAPISVT